MNSFARDLNQENILSKFLDNQYEKAGLSCIRITDINLQHKGVDLIIRKDGLDFKIDEKAQLHYINKSLPTFALEIDYLKDKNLKEGWLFDVNKYTEYYSFVFSIHLIEGLEELKSVDDIKSCEVIIVNRLKLLAELSKKDLNYVKCKDISNQLREADKSSKKVDDKSGFNFQISRQLREEPVNLVVSKTFLASLGRTYNFEKDN